MKTIITVEDGKVTVEVDDKVYVELPATNPVVPVDKKPGEYIAVPENHESKADTPSPPQEPKNGVVSPPSTDSPETLPTGARTNSKQGSEKPRINKEPARNIWHIVVCRECTNDFKSKTGKAKYCPDCLKKRRNQLSLPAKRKPSPTPANGAWTPKAAVPKKERINGADAVEAAMAKHRAAFLDPWNCEMCRHAGDLCTLHEGLQKNGQQPPKFVHNNH